MDVSQPVSPVSSLSKPRYYKDVKSSEDFETIIKSNNLKACPCWVDFTFPPQCKPDCPIQLSNDLTKICNIEYHDNPQGTLLPDCETCYCKLDLKTSVYEALYFLKCKCSANSDLLAIDCSNNNPDKWTECNEYFYKTQLTTLRPVCPCQAYEYNDDEQYEYITLDSCYSNCQY